MGLFGNCSGDNNIWIWILIIAVILICCDGNIFGGGNNCEPCCDPCCEKPRLPRCEPECC